MAVRFTYHGSPFASQISQQGFRPGGLMSIAPGQVFSSPSASFASGYGNPVRMATPTNALSIPSANLSTGTIGSEVIQSPKAATKGMNLASKVGTTYTGPTAQRLMSGSTVAGLGPRGTSLLSRLTGGPLGIAALAGQGIGMGVDAIARATNTPEEYEAMKEAARVSGGTGYMDFTDEELGIDVDAAQKASTEPFNFGTAQAAEVTPTSTGQRINALGELEVDADRFSPGGDLYTGISTFEEAPETYVGGKPADVFTGGRPSKADIAGEINENLRDLGNPTGDPRIGSEEQGLSGFPGIGPDAMGTVDPGFQNALNAREARMNEIAMQQNPDYGQFFDAAPLNEEKKGIDLGLLGLLAGPAGFLTGSNALRGIGLAANIASGRVGRGLGSLNRKMRGVNPDGTTRTQSQYEAARDARRTQGRIDSMLARKAAGKSYSEKNLQEQIGKQIAGRADKSGKGKKSGFTNPGTNSYGPHSGGGGGGGGGGGKIVCTMMNDSYGFGNFRNKIWLKHSRDLPKEYEIGYHTIFLPLVKFAKGEGKLNKVVKKTLEHIARHRTYDLKQEMKGKTHLLGRAYRKVLEPICFITGKIKSALGRG